MTTGSILHRTAAVSRPGRADRVGQSFSVRLSPRGRQIDPAADERAVHSRHPDLLAGVERRQLLVGVERGEVVSVEIAQHETLGLGAGAWADVPMTRPGVLVAVQNRGNP